MRVVVITLMRLMRESDTVNTSSLADLQAVSVNNGKVNMVR